MKMLITNECWERILEYAQSAWTNHDSEIGGMAIVHRMDDGSFLVDEPTILKQEISRGNTVLDKDALAEYYVKTALKHKDKKDLSFLWWHSHHTMEAFWSGTDLNAIDEFKDGTYSFSLVVNLKREYKFRVSVWDPIECHQDIEIEKLVDTSNVDDEVNALCQKPQTMSTWHSKSPVNSNQLQLYKNHEVNGWGHGAIDIDAVADDLKTPSHEQAVQLAAVLDEMLKNLCAGAITHKEFKKTVKQMNKKLEDSNHDWRIGELSVPDLRLYELHIEGEDLVYPAGENFDETEMIETVGHNMSFGHRYGGYKWK